MPWMVLPFSSPAMTSVSIVLGFLDASIFLTVPSSVTWSPRRPTTLPVSSRITLDSFSFSAGALFPSVSLEMGLQVPANAFNSFLKTSSWASANTPAEPKPVKRQHVVARIASRFNMGIPPQRSNSVDGPPRLDAERPRGIFRKGCILPTTMRAQAPGPMPKETVMRFYNQPHRFYCGVDLHARTMYLCILDQGGAIVLRK